MSEKTDETSPPAEEAAVNLSFTLTAYRNGRQVAEMDLSLDDLGIDLAHRIQQLVASTSPRAANGGK